MCSMTLLVSILLVCFKPGQKNTLEIVEETNVVLLNFGVHESRWSVFVAATSTGASQWCDGKQRFRRRNAIVQHSRTKPSLLCPLVGPFDCFLRLSMLMLSCLMGRIWHLRIFLGQIRIGCEVVRRRIRTSINPNQTIPAERVQSFKPESTAGHSQRLKRRKRPMPTGRHKLGWRKK